MIRVAIADDHAMMCSGISALISSFPDFEVTIKAADGKELLDRIKVADARPDICVLDINMPVLNGYETLNILTKDYPDINVLVLSMYDNEFSIIKMLSGGAKGYIFKDSDPLKFEEALTTVSGGNYYHSDFVTHRLLSTIHYSKSMLPNITQKELRFLELCCTELTYKEMGEIMGVSSRTVEGYRDTLFHKLQMKTRTGLAMYAIKMGLVSLK